MFTGTISAALLESSVIAVPPLARDSQFELSPEANLRIIRYLEQGGVSTLLYGGNAALAHISLRQYEELLAFLSDAAGEQTCVIPSFGPGFGQMLDQVDRLRSHAFPTAMLLPSREGTTPAGLAAGVRKAVDRLEKPIVLYIKHDGMIDVETVRKMMADGLISWIKYAVVRSKPEEDQFLKELVASVGPAMIVSGMGEQPTIVHRRQFCLGSFTSGCVCIAPSQSMAMLGAIKSGDFPRAETLRQKFAPLEAIRDRVNPVRVLHAAVRLAGIADTGPITPFWSPVCDSVESEIKTAAVALRSTEP